MGSRQINKTKIRLRLIKLKLMSLPTKTAKKRPPPLDSDRSKKNPKDGTKSQKSSTCLICLDAISEIIDL